MPSLQHFPVLDQQLLIDPKYKKIIEIIARQHTKGTSISWEDAVQTANIKIIEGIRKSKFHKSQLKNFYAWAKTVAKNAIIDMIRKERRCQFLSLDSTVPGTDVSLIDTVADDFNNLEAVEQVNLIEAAFIAIASLEKRFPKRGYMKLWEGMLAGKKQMGLATDLQVTQGEVSRRRRELFGRLAQELGLLNISTIKQEKIKQEQKYGDSNPGIRRRSQEEW
ncbi:MAG: sigma-70 family RNA polymerase sigma factor [Mastigocoleus sp.]